MCWTYKSIGTQLAAIFSLHISSESTVILHFRLFHLFPPHPFPLSSSLLHKTNRLMKLENLLNPVTRTGRSPDSSDSAIPRNIAAHSDLYYCRVPKACTHCRREKSRCDLRRPCHNCVKRNRSKECVDGCYPCRQMKKMQVPIFFS